jgi:capsular polysaccharide transport system permease protein
LSGFSEDRYDSTNWGLLQAIRVQLRVIGALTLREMSTRFGRDNLGYIWLFVEPALLGGCIGALHLIAGHELPGGPNVMIFWVMGYIPFYLFRGVVNRASTVIVGNQSLLYHRRVTVLDIVLARHLLEGLAVLGAMAGFTIAFGMAIGEWPVEPAWMVIGMLIMLALSNGVAMLIAAGAVYTDLFDRIVHMVTYVTMPALGCFFMVFWLPTSIQSIALTIPTVHVFEMVRYGIYGNSLPTTFDLEYVLFWSAVLNALGMLALRKARRHLVI